MKFDPEQAIFSLKYDLDLMSKEILELKHIIRKLLPLLEENHRLVNSLVALHENSAGEP